MVWEEQDCSESFPISPEAANLDLLNYLEQRDMWQRHQNLEVPKFCVGSIVAVTRADRFAPEGSTRFLFVLFILNDFMLHYSLTFRFFIHILLLSLLTKFIQDKKPQ